MYIKVRGADFSNVKIGTMALELSELTKEAIEASGNNSMTDSQKRALDDFLMGIQGEIFNSIEYLILPFIANSVNKAFVNYKNNTDYGGMDLYELYEGGIRISSQSETKTVKRIANTASLKTNNIFAITATKGKGSSIALDLSFMPSSYPQLTISTNGSGSDRVNKTASIMDSADISAKLQMDYSEALPLDEIVTYGLLSKDGYLKTFNSDGKLKETTFSGEMDFDSTCYLNILPSVAYNGTIKSGIATHTLYATIIGNGIDDTNMSKLMDSLKTLIQAFVE